VGVAIALLAAAFVASTVFGVVAFAGLVVAGAVDVGSVGGSGADLGATAFVVLAVASQLGLGIVGLAYARRYLHVTVRAPTRREGGLVVAGLFASLVAALALTALASLVAGDTGSVIDDAVTADPLLLPILALLSVILVAPIEELLFRGAIQGRLRRTFGPTGAIVGASALFGAIHVFNFTGTVGGGVAFAAAIGAVSLLWGYLYERTGNLLVPIVVHGLYNAALFGLSALALAGA
jgi:membrane protease YdiL (CAAX protease family)